MNKNKRLSVNISVVISIGLAVILLISLWQNYRSKAYEAILEKNIFLLNENLEQRLISERDKSDSQNEASLYLRWRYMLKEQVEQSTQLLSEKIASLKNTGKDRPLASLLYYNLGLAHTMSQDFLSAINDFEEAVRLDPNNSYSYYNLGLLYSAYANNAAKAEECYKKYLDLSPKGIYSQQAKERIRQFNRSSQ